MGNPATTCPTKPAKTFAYRRASWRSRKPRFRTAWPAGHRLLHHNVISTEGAFQGGLQRGFDGIEFRQQMEWRRGVWH